MESMQTDKSTSVRWMIVDGFGPIPSEIEAPIQNTIISNELIDVTICLVKKAALIEKVLSWFGELRTLSLVRR